MSRQGIVYIGECDTGKTTRLYHAYKRALMEKKGVLVIDSATEHVEKSLIKKIRKEQQGIWINSCREYEIVFPQMTQYSYPYELLKDKDSTLFLCDASYYLEKGYDYQEGVMRERWRKLYKYFSMQVIYVLLDRIDIILMDEIELLPEFRWLILKIGCNNIPLLMTLHETKGLAGLDNLFKIERVDKWRIEERGRQSY